MRHRYFWIASVFAVGAFVVPADAAPRQVDLKGSETTAQARNCTQIRNICELQAIGNTATTRAGTYCLARDIDASQIGTCGTGPRFQPIGTSAQPFTGRFDGRGFNIRNLSIVISAATKDAEVGLFGHVAENAFVHDVGLIDAVIAVTNDILSTELHVGGLVGTNKGRLQDAFVSGAVTCRNVGSPSSVQWQRCWAGGLVGFNGGIIKNVFSMAAMRGNAGSFNLGGLVGFNANAIEFAYAIGPVDCVTSGSQGDCIAGGLIGESLSSGSLANVFAAGSVQVGNDEIRCHFTCWAGGLIGSRGSLEEVSLLRSFATGAVSCFAEKGCLVGGLAGHLVTAPAVFTYATGSVSCDVSEQWCAAGGLVGLYSDWPGPVVRRSFAVGEVQCTSPDPTTACSEGGLAGVSNVVGYDMTTKSYWDKDTTGQPTSDGGGTGLTTQELQSALPAEFDPAKWAISYGSSYPYLTVANRWVPAVRSPTRTFRSRTTSFWGSLALAESSRGRFAVFPAGQLFPWEYYAYDMQKASASSKATTFAMLGRVIGSGKPKKRAVYTDNKSDPLSLARIDYFMDANGKAAWPLADPHLASGASFYAGPMLIEDPSDALPASFNRQDILTQLEMAGW